MGLHRFLNQDVVNTQAWTPSIACLFGATIYPDQFTNIIRRFDVFRGQWLNRKDGIWSNAT